MHLLSIIINNSTTLTSVHLLICHGRMRACVLFLFYIIQTKLPTVMRLRVCRLITCSCRSVLFAVATTMKRFPSLCVFLSLNTARSNGVVLSHALYKRRREILKNPFFSYRLFFFFFFFFFLSLSVFPPLRASHRLVFGHHQQNKQRKRKKSAEEKKKKERNDNEDDEIKKRKIRLLKFFKPNKAKTDESKRKQK